MSTIVLPIRIFEVETTLDFCFGIAISCTPGHQPVSFSVRSGGMISPGLLLRRALGASKGPLQIAGAINAYSAILAKDAGFTALYLSGGGVSAASLGVPDLGIINLEDILIDIRRITG